MAQDALAVNTTGNQLSLQDQREQERQNLKLSKFSSFSSMLKELLRLSMSHPVKP
jgi:hypothetical protein